MVQIGCRCPLDKQDALLERVREFGAREVPAKWHEQLMVVGAEAKRGGSSGGGRKGKGKMRAADDDGVGSSDEEAARQLEEQEQELIQRACQESLLAAGSTGSSSGTARPRYSRSRCTPINYSEGTRSVDYSSTRWPLGWWLFCLGVCVWAWVAVGGWVGSG
jgi:hypothetical protein